MTISKITKKKIK